VRAHWEKETRGRNEEIRELLMVSMGKGGGGGEEGMPAPLHGQAGPAGGFSRCGDWKG